MFEVRFDDAIAGSSRVLTDPIRSHVAFVPEEVDGVLASVERASRDGFWVGGYVAYEAASAFDPALATLPPVEGRPLAWFGVFGSSQVTRIEAAQEADELAYVMSAWRRGMSQSAYGEAFAKVKEAILQGDTYQINLTFPLKAAFTGSVDLLYRDLIRTQRPAYAAHIAHDSTHVVSVSPERFFAVDGRRITTKPMKGTARRGRWTREDDAIRDALAASEKDRAENLMIVDLIRNDLGRVATFGSVEVERLFDVERYHTLWQMTSTVAADLRPDVGLRDVFRALFPCGSVTGAPKASSMGIIAEVESSSRGVYCGAIGYIPPGDGLDGASFNVAIRTVVLDEHEGIATYGVGGGITWDSDLSREYDEAATKALVLTREPPPDSLIETIRWDPAEDPPWRWLEPHLDRLRQSGDYWGIEVDDQAVRSSLEVAVAGHTHPLRVRVEVHRDARIDIAVGDAPERFPLRPGPAAEPVRLGLAAAPVDSTDPRLFHKLGDRSLYDTQLAQNPQCDDVVLHNHHGHVTETTICNIVFLIDGVWVTPPLEDGVLRGIMRRHLIDSGAIKERSVTIDDALGAEAVGVINSVRGWRPAVLNR